MRIANRNHIDPEARRSAKILAKGAQCNPAALGSSAGGLSGDDRKDSIMIEEFTKAWFANLHTMREKFTAKHPEAYIDVVRAVVEMLAAASDEYDKPDPQRIHEIDDGFYQGTLVYVIGCAGYQPSRYWSVKVDYGSCSGCDTLEAIRFDTEPSPTEHQVKEYMTLALHIVQGLRDIDGSRA